MTNQTHNEKAMQKVVDFFFMDLGCRMSGPEVTKAMEFLEEFAKEWQHESIEVPVEKIDF